MIKDWKIQLYETSAGDRPVEEFILSLSIKGQNKVARTFEHLQEFGPRLGAPHLKKLTNSSLWELRILGGDSIRIFYVTATGKTFILLHGFIKKQQKTPKKELTLAEKRFNEYKDLKKVT